MSSMVQCSISHIMIVASGKAVGNNAKLLLILMIYPPRSALPVLYRSSSPSLPVFLLLASVYIANLVIVVGTFLWHRLHGRRCCRRCLGLIVVVSLFIFVCVVFVVSGNVLLPSLSSLSSLSFIFLLMVVQPSSAYRG